MPRKKQSPSSVHERFEISRNGDYDWCASIKPYGSYPGKHLRKDLTIGSGAWYATANQGYWETEAEAVAAVSEYLRNEARR